MKPPRIPPLIIDIVQSGLLACEGIVFETRDSCPVCGGTLSGYDTKKKQFGVIREEENNRLIHIVVKRFSCRQCHAVCFADEPFYPETRIGSPLVDLCRTLAAGMPFNRAAVFMAHMGILIERGTVRNYAHRRFPEIPSTELYGIRLPVSIISLADLATRFGEGSRIPGAEALAACGFPSAYRAPPYRLLPPEKRNERNEEKDKEERKTQTPY
jgi:hypothetical protein